MFESIVSSVLNQVLGSYVDNLDGSQLKLGIFSGNVVLKNLKLKKEAVDKLNLPIEIFEGHLGSLELRIPWANLKTQPVRVFISDLYVLAGPATEVEYDKVLEEKKIQQVKQELLETAELFRSSNAAKSAENDDTFMSALITKIIDNLQVVIKNIHVRFEDSKSHPGSPFSLGLTLSNLSAVSTDPNWNEAFLEDPKAPTHKLLKLDSLAMYWIPRSESLMNLAPTEFISKFKSLIHSEENEVDLRYLLKPVSGIGKILLRKRMETGKAKNLVNLEFESFRIKMDDEQYYDVLMLAQNFILASRNVQYRQYRPLKAEASAEKMLKYAITCVLEKIKARNRTRLWINVIKRRQVRKKYVSLFKKREVDGALQEETGELGHFKMLEEMTSFEDLKFYRSLARSEMKQEKLIPFALRQQQQLQAQKATNFVSRWWYGGGNVALNSDDSLIKEEDVKKFYETIDFDETAREREQELAEPRNSKLIEIMFDLKSGSISLAQTDIASSSRKTILSLQFIDLIAHVITRPDTLRVEVSLLDFSIIEKLTEFSIFPNLVRAKPKILSTENAANIVHDEVDEINRLASNATEPFLSFVMDELAENLDADKSISLAMKPLEIVLNHQAAQKIVDFVYGGRARDALETLASAAETHITELATKTRASLENALEEHKALDLSVDIDAPVIYIPFDCEDPAGFLFVADLGHIEVRSRLVSAEQKSEFSLKRKRPLTVDEVTALYNLMYDVLNIRLSRIKLSYAASLKEWQQLSLEPEFLPETNRIIDDIDVSLSVASCIVPKATNLAQKKIYARLPAVQVIFSDEKYKLLMRLVETIVPSSSNEDSSESQVKELNSSTRTKSILDTESTTRHSLTLSPQMASVSVSESSDEEFFDALDSSESVVIEVPEHEAISVDLLVEIEEVCLKMIRENRRYAKKELLTLVAKKLKIACNVKPFNTVVNLLLEAFFIRDDMNFNSEQGEVFLLSGLSPGTANEVNESDVDAESLLRVNANLVDSQHPLFETEYNSANVQVLLELASLNFYANPSTLIQTAEFFETMFEEEEKEKEKNPEDQMTSYDKKKNLNDTAAVSRTASKRTISTTMAESEIISHNSLSHKKATEQGKKILFTAKLSELALVLGIGSEHFSDVVLKSATGAVCVESCGDLSFNGKISDFAILHTMKSRKFEFLRIDGENALEVNYQKISLDQFVKLGTGALHFTYDALFIEDACGFAAKLAREAKLLEVKRVEREKRQRKARKAAKREAKTFEHLETVEEQAVIAAASSNDASTENVKLQFEIDISSPVLDFPHPEGLDGMVMSVFLGHIHSSNSFKSATDIQGNPIKSVGLQLVDQFINAKLEAMRIELKADNSPMAKLLDDVCLSLNVSLISHAIDRDYAETDVEGGIDVVRLKVARRQLKQTLSLVDSLQRSLERALKPLESIKSANSDAKPPQSLRRQQPEEFILDEHNPIPTAVEVLFNVKSIELILFEEWEIAPLARFALENLSTNLIMQRDNSMILEQYVSNICARDLRTTVQRKFKDIILPDKTIPEDDIKFKYEKTNTGDSIVKVEVNAPKVVLSMDLVNSILAVFDGISPPAKVEEEKPVKIKNDTPSLLTLKNIPSDVAISTTSSDQTIESVSVQGEPVKTFILAEIGALALYILEDPDSVSSEAMQLSVKKITFAQQTNMSLSIDSISAGFVNMDRLDEEAEAIVQFIDPFDVTATVELSTSAFEKATQVWAIVKPISCRFSYQDIQFFTKLSEQFAKKPEIPQSPNLHVSTAAAGSTTSHPLSPITLASSPALSLDSTIPGDSETNASLLSSSTAFRVIEKLQINLEGIRLMFIDDFANVHIPLLDVAVDRISSEFRDWSSLPSLSGILKIHANFYNRLNSHWEPIIEPWALDLSLATKKPDGSEILFNAERALEIIASHPFLESILSVSGKMAVAEPRAASSYREVAKPYLIKNYTGHALSLWADKAHGVESVEIVEIPANSLLPFEFEDWKTFRTGSSSSKSKTHRISVHLMDSPWESVKNIGVDQQGLFVFPLRPKIHSISHKLVCEIEVIEGIRHIILRSATCFKNSTSFNLEIADIAAEHFSDTITIKSGDIGALPISFSAGGSFKVRPAGLNYQWSSAKYDLFDLFGKQSRRNAASNKKQILSRPITCPSDDSENSTPFFMDLHCYSDTPEEIIYASASLAAAASKSDASASKFYGLGTIILSASIELENLLPFDLAYRIYDHDGKYDFCGTLLAGKMNPLHGVDSKHVIGLSLEIDSQTLVTSQVAVINGGSCDKCVLMTDSAGLSTSVFIDYDVSDKLAAKRVRIYSPYVIINQSGVPFEFKSSTALLGSDQIAAGQSSDSMSKPLLFSYPESNFVSGKDRIKIRTGQSDWSRPISLDAVGNVSNFDLYDKKEGKWYNFALYVHLGSDRFSKVHIIKISPRFAIVNRIPGRTVFLSQGDSSSSSSSILEIPEGTLNFHCNPSNFKNLRLSYDSLQWTPKFVIGDVCETFLKLFEGAPPAVSSKDNLQDAPMDLIKVSSVLELQVLYIVLTKEQEWPFRIVNSSSVEVKLNQKGCSNDRLLLSGESEDFAWDDPSGDLVLSVYVMERQRDYNIRELGQCKPLIYRSPGGQKSYISVNVEADGPVIVVKFRNYDVKASKGIFRLLKKGELQGEEEVEEVESDDETPSEAASSTAQFKVKSANDETQLTFTLRMAGLGISLIGDDLVEFMYIYAKGLEFRMQQSKLFQTLGFKIRWFQIDNCLFDYTHPILMYPAVVEKTESELDAHPALNIGIIKSMRESRGVDYYKYFGVLLQEMNIELGEELLQKVLLFAQFKSIIPPPSPLLQNSDFCIPPLRLESVDARLMYYELFQIHPVKLNVTFSRTESSNSSEGISAYNPLGPLLSILSMASGNISDAPLKFNSLLLEHPIVSSNVLKDRVIGHYTQQAIVQVHKILGSIDMLGNPVGLFNTMGEGVTDLFYEPYQGFVSDRPQDIGIGLAKGGFSFMRKTVSGLTGTFSKFTGSLSKGLAAATLDTSFQRNRRTSQARNRPSNAVLGISTGAKSFYQGFASGLSGIVEKPMEGAKASGVGGFFKGVGIGLLGAVTKPIVGTLDLTASITEGVKNTADGEADEIAHIRWSRVIPYDSIITAYSAREAYGQSCLASCIDFVGTPEKYFAHLEVPEDECIVFVTTTRILYVKRRNLNINWQVSFGELLFCRPNFDTILLSVRQGDIRKRIIFCNDPSSQEWFCMKVDEGLANYNEKHRAIE